MQEEAQMHDHLRQRAGPHLGNRNAARGPAAQDKAEAPSVRASAKLNPVR